MMNGSPWDLMGCLVIVEDELSAFWLLGGVVTDVDPVTEKVEVEFPGIREPEWFKVSDLRKSK